MQKPIKDCQKFLTLRRGRRGGRVADITRICVEIRRSGDVGITSVSRRYYVGAPVLGVYPDLTPGPPGSGGFDSCQVRDGQTGGTDAVKQVQTVSAQDGAFRVDLNGLEEGVDGRAQSGKGRHRGGEVFGFHCGRDGGFGGVEGSE